MEDIKLVINPAEEERPIQLRSRNSMFEKLDSLGSAMKKSMGGCYPDEQYDEYKKLNIWVKNSNMVFNDTYMTSIKKVYELELDIRAVVIDRLRQISVSRHDPYTQDKDGFNIPLRQGSCIQYPLLTGEIIDNTIYEVTHNGEIKKKIVHKEIVINEEKQNAIRGVIFEMETDIINGKLTNEEITKKQRVIVILRNDYKL